jgi:hypothetical protein
MKERTVWELARMAECSDPDTDSSPGADFLRAIESSVKEALNLEGYDEIVPVPMPEDWAMDQANEVADLCIPVYTHNLWVTFVDLAAYSEDVSDYTGTIAVGTPEQLPNLALYMIGERLALALFEDETADSNADSDQSDEGTE